MSDIQWKLSYQTGHPLIDHQHEGLIRLMSELDDAIQQPASDEEIWRRLEELALRVREHFHCEEKLMQQQEYPLLAEHRLSHHQILHEGARIYKACRRGETPLDEILPHYLRQWAAHHIVEDDAKLAAFLQQQARQ